MNQQTLSDVKHGNKAAFAVIVQHFQTPLFAYLGRMGVQQSIAEEIIQETFIRAWQARERFDASQSAYSTWLFTIVRRLTINELDRASRRHEQSAGDGIAGGPHIEHYAAETATPLEQLETHAQQACLKHALQALPLHERSLLALAYIRELEFGDIAKIENIPIGTVKSRLHRIRGKLKASIETSQQ